jgi:pantothenate kinase
MPAHNEEITLEEVYNMYLSMKRDFEDLREDIDILVKQMETNQNETTGG